MSNGITHHVREELKDLIDKTPLTKEQIDEIERRCNMPGFAWDTYARCFYTAVHTTVKGLHFPLDILGNEVLDIVGTYAHKQLPGGLEDLGMRGEICMYSLFATLREICRGVGEAS